MVEVRIGVARSKEIIIKSDEKAEDITSKFEETLAASGSDGQTVLWLSDNEGKKVGIPVTGITYVEIENKPANDSVGFGIK